MLDYCVVKMPRLPFDKFISAKRTLTTQMKATGEVMSICDNFEGALMKAIRSLSKHVDCLLSYDFSALSKEEILEKLEIVDDRRIWMIAEALRKGISYDEIHAITKIDKWFIDKIAILVEMEQALKTQELTPELLKEAKRIEFPDNVIARLTGKDEREIHDMRHANGIVAKHTRWLIPVQAEFAKRDPILLFCIRKPERSRRDFWQKESSSTWIRTDPYRTGYRVRLLFCTLYMGICKRRIRDYYRK